MPRQTPEGWIPRVGDKFTYGDSTTVHTVIEAPNLESVKRPLSLISSDEGLAPSVWNYSEEYPFIWTRKRPTIIIQCKNP